MSTNVLKVDTKALCLFCYSPCDTHSSQSSGVVIDSTSLSGLDKLMRYLEVDINQLFKSSGKLLTNVGYNEELGVDANKEIGVVIELCYTCSLVMAKFDKLYNQYGGIGPQVDQCIRAVHRSIKYTDENPARVREYLERVQPTQLTLLDLFNASFAGSLRSETFLNCCSRLMFAGDTDMADVDSFNDSTTTTAKKTSVYNQSGNLTNNPTVNRCQENGDIKSGFVAFSKSTELNSREPQPIPEITSPSPLQSGVVPTTLVPENIIGGEIALTNTSDIFFVGGRLELLASSPLKSEISAADSPSLSSCKSEVILENYMETIETLEKCPACSMIVDLSKLHEHIVFLHPEYMIRNYFPDSLKSLCTNYICNQTFGNLRLRELDGWVCPECHLICPSRMVLKCHIIGEHTGDFAKKVIVYARNLDWWVNFPREEEWVEVDCRRVLLQCDLCGDNFSSMSRLTRHKKQGETCSICGEILSGCRTLETHTREEHTVPMVMMEIQGRKETEVGFLFDKIIAGIPRGDNKCGRCGEETGSFDELKRHMMVVHFTYLVKQIKTVFENCAERDGA